MSRFDNRDISTFKKDIKFGTKLEKYFAHKWAKIAGATRIVDNGADNTGAFIASGKTSGADYLVDYGEYKNLPLEIKWVPNYGKLTMKVGDLEGYIKEKAAILFIYNSLNHGLDLRKPIDYNLDTHVEKIECIAHQLKWGIMYPDKVKSFLETHRKASLIQKISYMGGKPGIILKQDQFHNWFEENNWSV